MEIKFRDNKGVERKKEPASFGVPFPPGVVKDADALVLKAEGHGCLAFGHRILARWQDQSIKWLLIDVQVDVPANGEQILTLMTSDKGYEKQEGRFKTALLPMEWDGAAALECRPEFVLTDALGNVFTPEISSWQVEHDTDVRKTILISGEFGDNTISGIEWQCRLHFFDGKAFIKCEFTIVNTRAARHAGGAWDLGDENSFLFKDLSVIFKQNGGSIQYTENFDQNPELIPAASDLMIYQGSSGLSNWQSKNHMNRNAVNPVSVDGYRVVCDGKATVNSQSQASPLVCVNDQDTCFYCWSEKFWQNFPKHLSAGQDGIRLGLFPEQFGDLFELQPGEQKTHLFYYGHDVPGVSGESLQWMTDPLVPGIDCGAYYDGMLRPRPVPGSGITLPYDEYLGHAIDGAHRFKNKNEIIDEYGWRNFGDIFADHESVFNGEDSEFISHYNNQYDVIKGAVIQFMRSGDRRWFDLAVNLGDHVCDIDIYHTDQDKYQYNRGLFWHTDHHLDAHTCTHRTISEKHREAKPEGAFGGGPYLEHNYATGLVYLYWLTGNERYRAGAVELCSFIVNWLEGPDTCVELLFQAVREGVKSVKSFGRKSLDEIYVLQGPCRASGNSLNTLLDGYLLTEDKKYLRYAEQVISLAVHPEDDLNEMNLLNAEVRWFYTVFLQALGRYLDIKQGMGPFDDGFAYGRAVLLHYAKWMAAHEYPYLERPEILEFPNETWAAQDIRKADIFALASHYAPEGLAPMFKDKARFFSSTP